MRTVSAAKLPRSQRRPVEWGTLFMCGLRFFCVQYRARLDVQRTLTIFDGGLTFCLFFSLLSLSLTHSLSDMHAPLATLLAVFLICAAGADAAVQRCETRLFCTGATALSTTTGESTDWCGT